MSNSSPGKLSKEDVRKARLRAMGIEKSDETESKTLESAETKRTIVIDASLDARIRRLVISNLPEEDIRRWYLQGFRFCSSPPFGLRQGQGGPCGILAVVQAEILIGILYNSNHPDGTSALPQVSTSDLHRILATAFVNILFRASYTSTVKIVDTKSDLGFNGSFRNLLVYEFDSKISLYSYLLENIADFEATTGCMLFLLSLLCTRSPDVITNDMDDPNGTLIGQFGHCNQELMNLLLTGRATSNVFDGSLAMGDSGLSCNGTQSQADIGYLSYLEALRYVQVGRNYKVPRHPVWVIGSSSHFSVIFSTVRKVNTETSEELLLEQARSAFKSVDSEESGFILTDKLPLVLETIGAMKFLSQANSVSRLSAFLQIDSGGGGNIILWSMFWEHVSRLMTGVPLNTILNPPYSAASPSSMQLGSRGRSDSEIARALQDECDAETNSSFGGARERSDSDFARSLQAQLDSESGLEAVSNIAPSTPSRISSASGRNSSAEASPYLRTALHRHDSIADEKAEGFRLYYFNGLEDATGRKASLQPFTLYKRAAVSSIGLASVPLDGSGVSGGAGGTPLEEVLRTRWPGCRIDWEGAGPPRID